MLAKKTLLCSVTLLIGMGLIGCTSTTVDHASAQIGYVNVDEFPDATDKINKIRLQALAETASSLGARGALAWRSRQINKILDSESDYLDSVFSFNQLLLDHNVLPPVLEESNGNLNLADNDTIRMSDKTYRVVAKARFTTSPPTWRDYLLLPYQQPPVPNRTLLPINKEEAKAWDKYLALGWKEGLQQANDIFSANLNRLKRDYVGMALYRKLLAQGMISQPEVAKADLGITGNSEEIHINDEVMRITVNSALQPDSDQWNPVITK